tara:strand:- start:609 stop:866 length:258 start_codon:yes stop_codon:yes gene_type:complete
MTFHKIPKEAKEQVLLRVKSGVPVSKAAKEHGIGIKTIYGWMNKQADRSPSALEVGRLRRERDELLKIIGTLTLELNKTKKNNNY